MKTENILKRENQRKYRKIALTLEILFKLRKHGTVYVKMMKIKHNLNQFLPPNFRVNY